MTPYTKHRNKCSRALDLVLGKNLAKAPPKDAKWVSCHLWGRSQKAVLRQFIYNRFPTQHRKCVQKGGYKIYYLSQDAAALLADIELRQATTGNGIHRDVVKDLLTAITVALKHFLLAALSRPKTQPIT